MNNFPDDVRCNIEIYRDDILYYKCKQASNLWSLFLKVNLTYETLWTGAGKG